LRPIKKALKILKTFVVKTEVDQYDSNGENRLLRANKASSQISKTKNSAKML